MSLERNKPKTKSNRRVFHWTVAVAFFVLALSGLILYTPAFSTLAADSWTRIVHRVAAVLLASIVVVHAVTNRRAAQAWLRDAAFWTAGPSANPDPWKRRHKTLIAVGVALLAVTGFIQWFLKDALPRDAFFPFVMVHDILFFSAVIVLLFHVYHEFDWWFWKKRRCASCPTPLCARVCPSNSISVAEDGSVRRDDACNNCRLCMNACRRRLYYVKSSKETDVSKAKRP
ncbi:MAG: cytochrome b/b6 domain-containing protein [Dehalococcoidia bacterium]|nr:cytochrome b/b6 domain-containing protein [Dehalococcoidia bacterium]